MAIKSRWFLTVSMDIPADKEDLFNEVYESEHMPLLAAVPGVLSATRAKVADLEMQLSGRMQTIDPGGAAKYSIIYEIESPDVLKSEAWGKAGEQGRWPTDVRPHSTNRSLILREVISQIADD